MKVTTKYEIASDIVVRMLCKGECSRHELRQQTRLNCSEFNMLITVMTDKYPIYESGEGYNVIYGLLTK